MSDKPSIIVRAFKSEDQDGAVEVIMRGLVFYSQVEGENHKLLRELIEIAKKTDLADLQQTYCGSGGNFWVATTVIDDEEVIVGCVGLEGKLNNEGELRRMFINAEYRRFGIGRMLLNTLEEWAKEHSIAKIWLTSARPARSAYPFYEAMGYVKVSVSSHPEDPDFTRAHFEKYL